MEGDLEKAEHSHRQNAADTAETNKYSMDEIYKYLRENRYPAHYNNNNRRALRRKAGNFVIKEGVEINHISVYRNVLSVNAGVQYSECTHMS
jgi:hypothetical protein